jgi:lysosomal Pro-X carboxypeptidase
MAFSRLLLCAALIVGIACAVQEVPRHWGTLLRARVLNSEFENGGSTFQKMGYPGADNCTTHWFTQFIDHYNFGTPRGSNGATTYQQRYLVYDRYYQPGGPIFFYTGNELDITVFANTAGLLWQTAEEFNAVIIFAEHRFFGRSQPCGGNFSCFPYLSTQQALADYAVLLTNLTSDRYKDSVGVIAFGGSYGGMLSAWIRIKYPNIITGSISASGPIGMVSGAYRRSSYWQVITRDATRAGGASPNCSWNVYRAIHAVIEELKTEEGRQHVAEIFKTCQVPSASNATDEMGYFIQAAFDLLGMGDYPYELNFIFGTYDNPAPAWPMRVACEFMKDSSADNETLMKNLVKAVSVVYNVTQDVTCNDININPTTGMHWDYMVCSEGVINELPYFEAIGWPNDMFYHQPVWTHQRFDEHCSKKFGVTTRWGWLNTTFGAGNVQGATNIVFSNGLLDPWHSGGILHNVSATVRSYIVPDGAHHLDLLFSTPQDSQYVQEVRSAERQHIREWLSALQSPK